MLDFIPVTLKNLFTAPATRKYPFVKREPVAGQRGHIVIDLPNCIFCGMCSRKCPVGAIHVERKEQQWAIERFNCITCGECVTSCPKKCLHMAGESTPAGSSKTTDTFKQPPKAPKEKNA